MDGFAVAAEDDVDKRKWTNREKIKAMLIEMVIVGRLLQAKIE